MISLFAGKGMGRQRLQSIIALGVAASVLFLYWTFVWGLNSGGNASTRENQLPHRVQSHIDDISKAIADNRSLLNQLRSHVSQLKKDRDKQKMAGFASPAKVPPRTQVKMDTHVEKPQERQNKPGVPHMEKIITSKPKTPHKDKNLDEPIIPVLVMACNRPSVSRSLDLLLKYKENFDPKLFPIVVSQDGSHQETKDAILGYGDKLTYMQHSMLSDNTLSQKAFNLRGYYKLAAHYKWALNQIFLNNPSANAVIIVEDDLEISPDFFSYFLSLHPLLDDPTLMCVSAWNDNGKTNSIDVAHGETLLYRSDFFPGLGWMLSRKFWGELEPKWPAAFWDDWLREPNQRKERSCIRPEISRTKTFGKIGVSNGQFYEQHLKYIQLNSKPVDWSEQDLSYLRKETYDNQFFDKIDALPEVHLDQLHAPTSTAREVKVRYSSAATFKAVASVLGIMNDFKSGVPRTAYHGVVTTLFNGIRVYVVPDKTWNGYDPSWR